jgi:streptogramin lyase
VLYTVRLAPSDLDSLHGVTARYYAGEDWHGPPVLTRHEQQLAADWTVSSPLPLPFVAEWEGFLHVPAAGMHQFVLETPAAAELWIDEYTVLAGTEVLTGSLQLAEGIHTVRMRAQGLPGRLQLSWQTPKLPLTLVPASLLYSATGLGQGLLGQYYPNGQWMPPAATSRIEARFARYVHVTPLPRPYTVEWVGKLVAPQDGVYRFGLESIDESMLWIGGSEVVRTTSPNTYQESELSLTAGLHDIRIRFADRTNHTQINVYWQPPGRERQILPAEALLPPRGNYDRFVFSPPEPAENEVGLQSVGDGFPATRLPGEALVVVGGLGTPRGIAVADDGRLYIAESGAGHVSIWDTKGTLLKVIAGSNQPLVEPADLAVTEGRLLVLDATAGAVRWFDLDGNPLPDPSLPGLDPSFAERSRGIGVTAAGEIWIANTSAGRIVRLDAAGGMAGQRVVWQDKDAQPVDVAGGIDGKIFVVDGQSHRLIRYAQDGQREQVWSLPAANTLDSPHLATDRSGRLYVSDPENGRVFLRTPDGEVAGYWDLAELIGHPVRPVGIAVDANGVVWVVDSAAGSLIALRQG